MKAKVIETQEVIEVEKHSYDYALGAQTFRDVNSGAIYALYDLEFVNNTYTQPKKIDWEQRRYELANAALNGMLAHSRNGHGYHPRDPQMNWHDAIAEEAIEIADAVIAKLNK